MKSIFAILASLLVLAVVPAASATSIHNTFNVGTGSVDVDVSNTDAFASFSGAGQFTGDMWSNDQGSYLDTDVDVSSSSGAGFNFYGSQDLAGYTNNQVETSAFAAGSTAGMNLRFDNSMYVVQLERHDTGKDFLSASGSNYGTGFQMGIYDPVSATYSAKTWVKVCDDLSGDGGSAAIDTNQWHATATGSYGWGNPDGIVSPSPPGYYTPTNTVTATGSGVYDQDGYGANSLTYNGMSMPGGGSAHTTASFNSGFGFNPVMYAS